MSLRDCLGYVNSRGKTRVNLAQDHSLSKVEILNCIQRIAQEIGGLAQMLKALADLTENTGLVSSSHMIAHSHVSWGYDALS